MLARKGNLVCQYFTDIIIYVDVTHWTLIYRLLLQCYKNSCCKITLTAVTIINLIRVEAKTITIY